MFKDKKETESPQAVEHTESLETSTSDPTMQSPSDDSGIPIENSVEAKSRAAKGTKRRSPTSSIFVVALAVAVGVSLLNCWINQVEPLSWESDSNDYRFNNWISKVEKMSPLEARLVEIQLQGLQARERLSPYGGDDSLGLLARFYLCRHRPGEAKDALKKSALLFDGAGWGREKVAFDGMLKWRWMTLLQLYLKDQEYSQAASTADLMGTRFYGLDAAAPESLEFHKLAQEAYSKTKQTMKAEQEARLIAMTRWLPRNSEVYATGIASLAELRRNTFEYAVAQLALGHDAAALSLLQQLVQDRAAMEAHVDSQNLLAATRMMIPVALVKEKKWKQAQSEFPRALRLAAQQKTLADFTYDARPPLFEAYADLLEYQGKPAEAVSYRQMAQSALNAPQIHAHGPGEFSEPATSLNSVDLYSPNAP